DEDNLPLPSFSRIECPMEYGYRQNMAVVKVLVQKGEGEAPALKLINRSRRKKFGPPPDAIKPAHQPPPESVARIQKLFAERPIWTRLALMNNLPVCDRRSIKMLLPMVAYLMLNGPWRDCWMRYGYDPRKNKEARLYVNYSALCAFHTDYRNKQSYMDSYSYQVTDIRNNRRPVRLERAKRLLRVQADLTTEMDELSLLPENYIKTTHIFDGKTAERDIAIFQLCDITDPLMRSLIDSSDSVQDICTVEELMRDFEGVKEQVEGELMQDEEGNLYELDELNEYDDIFGDNDSEFTEDE
ncbi:1819_t:CDS:2, partial [Cetraspora pellucida]